MKKFSFQFGTYIWLFFALLVIFVAYLQYMVNQSTEKLREEEIHKTKEYARHIAEWIVKETNGDIERSLSSDEKRRVYLNGILETFLIPKYRYIFVLTKDTEGHYRFLLDGSKEEKEGFKAIFFPQSRVFDEVYRTQKVRIVKQKNSVEGVWLSLLYPIVVDKKTRALLVLDLSKWYGSYIENFNSPLSYVIRMMQLFMIVGFLFLAFVFYRYRYLKNKALYDPLTRAYTKLYMEEYFNRHRVDEYHAVLVDIDEFREVNRIHGYDKGDRILREFVHLLQTLLPNDASIVRIGGAEFFIFFNKKEQLAAVAERLFTQSREKRYLLNNDIIKLKLSMSALEIPEDTVDIQHVLRMLDEELLKIKSHGKNTLSIINPQSYKELEHRHIDYIKKALEEERVTCLYQPIFHTETKKIHKYEALVRLIDENDPGILLPPSEFIDAIRGTSQYIKMSKQVFRHIFYVLEHYSEIEISVNLELDDLFNYDMMQMIMEYLYLHKEVAGRLTFEIIEQNEIQAYERIGFIFTQLKEFGSKIAIDDFGSGYSSYHYLTRFHIDILKIDGSLIKELARNPKPARAVLSSIRTIADNLGFELVAEHVSSEEIYNEVRALKIEYAQGYYLGEPKSIEAYMD
jgi:diguanylate cyclase (GGDEF)-like protein